MSKHHAAPLWYPQVSYYHRITFSTIWNNADDVRECLSQLSSEQRVEKEIGIKTGKMSMIKGYTQGDIM